MRGHSLLEDASAVAFCLVGENFFAGAILNPPFSILHFQAWQRRTDIYLPKNGEWKMEN
jgi:hypothetical protein